MQDLEEQNEELERRRGGLQTGSPSMEEVLLVV